MSAKMFLPLLSFATMNGTRFRVCRVGRSVRIHGVVGIAVVGRDDHITVFPCFFGYPESKLINGFDCFAYGIIHAGVSHHVPGKVEYNK